MGESETDLVGPDTYRAGRSDGSWRGEIRWKVPKNIITKKRIKTKKTKTKQQTTAQSTDTETRDQKENHKRRGEK